MANLKTIVLVGPMGVGKTTIGKKLAKKLAVPFVDTDALIVSEHGEISKLFETLGEAVFRQIEEDCVLAQLSKRIVLATGGGAVLSERTREALTVADVVYLSTDGRHMASRLSGGSRPLIKRGVADWRAIYESRRHLYEQVADITVDASALSLADTVDAIVRELSRHE